MILDFRKEPRMSTDDIINVCCNKTENNEKGIFIYNTYEPESVVTIDKKNITKVINTEWSIYYIRKKIGTDTLTLEPKELNINKLYILMNMTHTFDNLTNDEIRDFMSNKIYHTIRMELLILLTLKYENDPEKLLVLYDFDYLNVLRKIDTVCANLFLIRRKKQFVGGINAFSIYNSVPFNVLLAKFSKVVEKFEFNTNVNGFLFKCLSFITQSKGRLELAEIIYNSKSKVSVNKDISTKDLLTKYNYDWDKYNFITRYNEMVLYNTPKNENYDDINSKLSNDLLSLTNKKYDELDLISLNIDEPIFTKEFIERIDIKKLLLSPESFYNLRFNIVFEGYMKYFIKDNSTKIFIKIMKSLNKNISKYFTNDEINCFSYVLYIPNTQREYRGMSARILTGLNLAKTYNDFILQIIFIFKIYLGTAMYIPNDAELTDFYRRCFFSDTAYSFMKKCISFLNDYFNIAEKEDYFIDTDSVSAAFFDIYPLSLDYNIDHYCYVNRTFLNNKNINTFIKLIYDSDFKYKNAFLTYIAEEKISLDCLEKETYELFDKETKLKILHKALE